MPTRRSSDLATERTSAHWALRRHDARVLLKRKHPPCRRALGGPMSFWLPSNAPWSLDPGVRRENEGEESERPRGGDGAAATKRTSAQWALRRHGVPVSLNSSAPGCLIHFCRSRGAC